MTTATFTVIKERAKKSHAKAIGLINTYYAKAIRLIHAREFMAEFLATFILVVRHACQECFYNAIFCSNFSHSAQTFLGGVMPEH